MTIHLVKAASRLNKTLATAVNAASSLPVPPLALAETLTKRGPSRVVSAFSYSPRSVASSLSVRSRDKTKRRRIADVRQEHQQSSACA